MHEKLNLKKNKNIDTTIVKNFINININEILKIQHNSSNLNINLTLWRLSQYFKDLLSKNI